MATARGSALDARARVVSRGSLRLLTTGHRGRNAPCRRCANAAWRAAAVPALALLALLFANVASASTCVQATPGTYQWQNVSLAPQSGVFTHYISAKPHQATGDTLVGLSQGSATNWNHLAVIVRFNPNGTIDARDGDVYRALSYKSYNPAYWSGRIRLQVDVPRKTYSAWWWSWDADRWILLAKDFRFRTQQAGVTQLDNFTAEAEVGGIDACTGEPEPWVNVGEGAQQWHNTPLKYPVDRTWGEFLFFVRPQAANTDGLIAFSNGPQAFWGNLPMIVRFNSNNMIDVRNGSVYAADAPVSYVPGQTYKVMVFFNMSASESVPSTYSVYVAPLDGDYVRIAYNYAFRTEQQGVRYIDNWVAEAEQGGLSAYLAPGWYGQ